MKRNVLFLWATLLAMASCTKQAADNADAQSVGTETSASLVRTVKWADMDQLMNESAGKLYVINFWASWCRPCIEELPYFEVAKKQFEGKSVEFVLVSIDFASDLNPKVIPFVEKNKLQSTVWLLDEPDTNSWIDKVDPSWDGAIPVTLFVNKQKGIRKFVGTEVTQEELNALITSLL